jgi:hypothetical protein
MPNDRDRTSQGRFAKGNKAAFTSGLATGLGHSRLPKGTGHIRKALSSLRKRLEDASRQRHGSALTVLHDGLISTALAHERRKRLAERRLTQLEEAGTISDEAFDRLQDIIGQAAEQRDAKVAALLGPEGKAGVADALPGPDPLRNAAQAIIAYGQHKGTQVVEDLATK